MRKRFDLKTVKCDASKLNQKIDELETEWLCALLLRIGLSKVLIKKALGDGKYSSRDWREHLFGKYRVTINKHLKSSLVEVYQISVETRKKEKIAEWSRPDIIRAKNKKEENCKLELKYWQIL